MKTKFDPIQQLVLKHYCDGGMMWLVDKPDDLVACGDGLFEFLMVELSETEDCNNLETAIERIESAIAQLEDLSTKLELTMKGK